MSGPFTPGRKDRLYDLLPAVYRRRDEEQADGLGSAALTTGCPSRVGHGQGMCPWA